MNKTTTQFIHKWLPLNASYSINAVDTVRLCPFCTTCEEDHQHFPECPHPGLNTLWQEAAISVKSKLRTYDKIVPNQLLLLIGLAITDWRNTPQPPKLEFLSQQFDNLFQHQSTIGWHHIINGRFSKTWYQHLWEDLHEGVQWITFAIKTIWNSIYHIWKSGCQTNHGISNDNQTKRQMLRVTPQVHDLYNQQTDLPQDDQYIFQINVDELLTKPVTTIKHGYTKPHSE
jgi:hypothetical protein